MILYPNVKLLTKFLFSDLRNVFRWRSGYHRLLLLKLCIYISFAVLKPRFYFTDFSKTCWETFSLDPTPPSMIILSEDRWWKDSMPPIITMVCYRVIRRLYTRLKTDCTTCMLYLSLPVMAMLVNQDTIEFYAK